MATAPTKNSTLVIFLLCCFCMLMSLSAVVAGSMTNWFGLGTSLTSSITTATPDPTAISTADPTAVSQNISVNSTTGLTAISSVPVSASPSYVWVPFIDRPGGDINSTTAPTLAACEQLCTTTSGCSGATYDTPTQRCWVKSNVGNSGLGPSTYGIALSSNLPSSLTSPSALSPGSGLISPSQKFAFLMQTDNNAVVYDLSSGTPIWASNTPQNYDGSVQGLKFTLQNDGNGVIYDPAGKAMWASMAHSQPSGTYTLNMQDDGNLVTYQGGTNVPIWASNMSVTLFSDANYSGTSTVLKPGKYAVMPNGFPNDALSSIRVGAPATVTLYADTNFGGKSITLTGDSSYLSTFNDITSSLIVQGA